MNSELYTSLIKVGPDLSDAEHANLAKQIFLKGIEGIEISYLGGRWGSIWNENENYSLDFLKFYRGIKSLRLQLMGLSDIGPIVELADSLEYLFLGEIASKRVSVDCLRQLTKLRFLSIVRPSKGLEGIVHLNNLRTLELTGLNVELLDYICEIDSLKRLKIGFGTSASLNSICSMRNLEELDILWVKKLSDITALSNLTSLNKVKIEDEKQIRVFPDISKLKDIKNIRLMNLGGLEDISSLVQSDLKEFVLTGPVKNAEILRPLVDSNIERVYTYFYTQREQSKAEKMLGDRFNNELNFEMDNRAPLSYYDINTGQIIL